MEARINTERGVVNHAELKNVPVEIWHIEVNENFHGAISTTAPASLSWLINQVEKYLNKYNNRGNENHGKMYIIREISVSPTEVKFRGVSKNIWDIL